MVLDVSKGFVAPGTAIPFEVEVILPPQDVLGETVSFAKVHLQGHYCVAEGSIHLDGTLQTTAYAHCALCMEAVEQPLELSFSEVFRKDANEFEEEVFRYDGHGVPLTQMTLTLVMLGLPMRFLCKEDCKGSRELQAFKAEMSQSSCEDGLPTQRPFEALQSLLKKDEEV